MISELNGKKQKQKPLGVYLVEAGLITPVQVDIALQAQKLHRRRFGEILVLQGWVEQQTIEYLMEKVVLSERQTEQKKLYYSEKNRFSHSEPGADALLSTMPSRELKVRLSPKSTIRFLLFVVLSLVLANILGQFSVYFLPDYPLKYVFASLFNLEGELTIPALYSASALLLCSIFLAIIAYAKKLAGERYVRYWGALSIIFLCLSFDEVLGLHELMTSSLTSALHFKGFLYQGWVILGAVFVLICLLAFASLLTTIPAQTRRLFLIAGTLFVGGAIGMKPVEGYYTNLLALHSQQPNMTYAIIMTIEELLEMLAIIVFIYALLSYISSYMKGVSIQINIGNYKK